MTTSKDCRVIRLSVVKRNVTHPQGVPRLTPAADAADAYRRGAYLSEYSVRSVPYGVDEHLSSQRMHRQYNVGGSTTQ